MDAEIGRKSLFAFLFFSVLAGAITAAAQQSPVSPTSGDAPLVSSGSFLPRCAEIAGQGPQFDLLANVCQYSLSPESLPNFICEETIRRWTNGHKFDLITTEVTVIRGLDSHSNNTRDGKPTPSIEIPGGWISNALFGTELNAIFSAGTKSVFNFRRQTRTHPGRASEFVFHFSRSGTPGFALIGSYPGMDGLITINQKTGELERVETKSTQIDPAHPLRSYKSVLYYAPVPIPDLGKLVLPTSGEVKVCKNDDTCYRNELLFHDCRKFGSESTIVPNAAPGP